MRPWLRTVALASLFALAAWPFALQALHRADPVLAVQASLFAERTLLAMATALAVVLVVGGLLFPPIPAGIRLLGNRARLALTSDRTPLQRAQGELRHVETGQRHVEVGRVALRLGDLRTATPHLLRAVELEPNDVPTRFYLGMLLKELGRVREAFDHFAFVVERDPRFNFGEAMLQLGRSAQILRQDALAAEVLKRHQREHGGSRRSHFWLADALTATGDRAGARAALEYAAGPLQRGEKLTAEENWFRAKARVRLRRFSGAAT